MPEPPSVGVRVTVAPELRGVVTVDALVEGAVLSAVSVSVAAALVLPAASVAVTSAVGAEEADVHWKPFVPTKVYELPEPPVTVSAACVQPVEVPPSTGYDAKERPAPPASLAEVESWKEAAADGVPL